MIQGFPSGCDELFLSNFSAICLHTYSALHVNATLIPRSLGNMYPPLLPFFEFEYVNLFTDVRTGSAGIVHAAF
jgi:hypothetical protein